MGDMARLRVGGTLSMTVSGREVKDDRASDCNAPPAMIVLHA
jgi:hypothetical protein